MLSTCFEVMVFISNQLIKVFIGILFYDNVDVYYYLGCNLFSHGRPTWIKGFIILKIYSGVFLINKKMTNYYQIWF